MRFRWRRSKTARATLGEQGLHRSTLSAGLTLAALLAAWPLAAQQVELGLDRFQELWERAHPAAAPLPPSPPILALEGAECALTVAGDTARLTTARGPGRPGALRRPRPRRRRAALEL